RSQQRADVPMLLLFSARTWDDVIFRDELLEMQRESESLQLAFALTREPARREQDYSRRVDAQMMAAVVSRLPGAPRQVYICGSNPFVEAAGQGLIAAAVPAGIIRTERYG